MGQNGEVNSKFGAYRSLCCRAEIVINAGSAFPDCPNHPKLTTIWKPVLDETIIPLTGPQSDPPLEGHIENRRLFEMASGRLKLAEWEQNHLHGCKVCQGVLHVFIHQPLGALSENLEKPGDAA